MRFIHCVLRRHLGIICRYPAAAAIAALSIVATLVAALHTHQVVQSVAYVTCMWFCAFITDVVVLVHPMPGVSFPIKRNLFRELSVIFICTALGLLFLLVRFSLLWNQLSNRQHFLFIPLLVFTFPIALAFIYFFVFKYKFSELGVNFRYWYLPAIIHLAVGAVTLTFAPQASHWKAWFAGSSPLHSITEIVVSGLLGAALSEEFLRMLLQVRLAKALNNTGLGFVAASVIWAAMHIPSGMRETHHFNWLHSCLGVATLLPIGLMWGYITHRTRSLFPVVLVHGLNLWGLQNL